MTPHFTFEEATRTGTGLVNLPSAKVAAQIGVTAMHMEKVRELLNAPILVTSWFRSEPVNDAVGGSDSSAHIDGNAVDFKVKGLDNFTAASSIRDSAITFDQLILEYGWIHISFDPRFRGEVTTKKSKGAPYVPGLVR